MLTVRTAEYFGVTIDVGRQKLYYTDESQPVGKLGELSTDGTGHRVLIAANNSLPLAVVIDDVNRFQTLHCVSKNFTPFLFAL